jgi:hypothetical protein
VEDTTALHRCGLTGLDRVRRDGQVLRALLDKGSDPRPFLRHRNADYRRIGLTMGGVADCLALTFALQGCFGAGESVRRACAAAPPTVRPPATHLR